MSAQIPETMPLRDLLKSTGYDCPEELMDKTFAEATSGGSGSTQTNKAATINVADYTEPVVVEPDSDYDAMKKTTVTLTNIPSGADIEANKAATIDISTYTEPVEITPTAGKDGMAKATVTLSNIPSAGGTLYAWKHSTNKYWYTTTPTIPESDFSEFLSKVVHQGNGGDAALVYQDVYDEDESYAKVSDTSWTRTYDDGGTEVTVTYTRDSTKDFVIGA